MPQKSSFPFLILALVVFLIPSTSWGYTASEMQERLRTALAQPTAEIGGYPLNADELRRFYMLRDFKPVWDTDPEGDRDSIKNFMSSIAAFASYHGLISNGFPSEQLAKLVDSKQDADSLKIELLVSAWMLKIAHVVHGDSVKLAYLYPGWAFHREDVDFPLEMSKAIDDNRAYDFVASLAPSDPAYLQLARTLKVYRDYQAQGPWPVVSPGPTLHVGDHSPRVQQIRARLAAEGYLPDTDMPDDAAALYDTDLQSAVETYQSRNGLQADGNIGKKTVDTMNVSLDTRIDQIMANMERWRHMPRQRPSRYALVNIAAATVNVWDNGANLYTGPVVVGRPDRKTPFIQSSIRSVIFNPSWHVPAKIARKDILPKLRKDPHYLEKMGFVINGSSDDPHGAAIDWHSIRESDFNFRLRQSPGDINSLGRLKFDFDNDFAVYMHGTPHKELFEKAERNQSSGCIRLRDPDQFAVIVLATNEPSWTLERVQAEVDKAKTRWLKIDDPLPLYVVYWTVFAEENEGPMNFRNDVYNYDSFLMETLRKDKAARANAIKESL